ncbi:MAG TPA: SUMF1/EgtB/PvdO family nonheme iron enzyme [Candidatus Baltobacteraceae bacterium]|nr:SUMF1/EgtB/PvdO family nonheme iron enzyme [Candidatus Baltobacteraceae bacterium]
MDTLAAAEPVLDRDALARWYRRNRERSERLFGLVDEQSYYERPIALRHPFAFYEGHLPAFSFLVLNERGLRQEPLDARLEKLFERGIDPASTQAAQALQPSDWPTRAQILEFGSRCDQRVLDAIAHAKLADASVPRLARGQAVYTILEHEAMHHETLVYIIHRLAADRKTYVHQEHTDSTPPANEFVDVAAGTAVLGADRETAPFGWDNEFAEHSVDVERFGVQRYPVTNGEYLEFVRDGGPPPPFWIERDGGFALLGAFEELPLPKSWPVYATNDQARAYAAWKGARLMTEAEYHRAAFATPGAHVRAMPWGDAPPQPQYGNFDFAQFDPQPVDAHPAGASAWGVEQLVGNGWEWTQTPFAPFEGFEPMASYPQYSTDFFDGKHYVMKGASPVTARELLRSSFRNWFYADYPYMYAKFRCARSA